MVVGYVERREPHPDADKLSVCSVETGADEPAQIVCGAKNVAAGMKLAVAVVPVSGQLDLKAMATNAAEAGEGEAARDAVVDAGAAAEIRLHVKARPASLDRLHGRQERAVVRPPLMKLSQSEIDRIAAGLKQARVGRDGAEDLDLDPIRGLAAE